jgi:hypothetical protein
MIHSDYMSESIDQDHDRSGTNNGVSLTHDIRMAWSFADRSSYIFGSNHNHKELNLGNMPFMGAIVELNADLLRSHNYRMVHYVDHYTFDDGDGDESEVRVIGQIKPLSSVMTSFSFKPVEIEWFKKWMATDYATGEAGYLHSTTSMLDSLLKHPKFKPA